MSVHTEANTRRDQAIESVKGAISSLSAIVIDQCWGTQDFGPDYRKDLAVSLMELIAIRERL